MPRSTSSTAPAADHADAALWPLALGKDRRAGREELHLGPAREPLQLSLVEPAEGVPPRQELGDVMHPTLPAV